jgi:hypothetical protein
LIPTLKLSKNNRIVENNVSELMNKQSFQLTWDWLNKTNDGIAAEEGSDSDVY